MGYRLSYGEMDDLFRRLAPSYRIFAPKRFEKEGRYSDTDVVRYDRIERAQDIVWDQKSDFSAREVLTPITDTIFYFTEDEYRESHADPRKILLFLRPCDINAFERQDQMLLHNGVEPDFYYKRMREKVRFVMMECAKGFDTCFCVSMNANKTDNYSLSVRFTEDGALMDVKDMELLSYFQPFQPARFQAEFVEENELKVEVPRIPNKDVLAKLKKHPMWQEYNSRCISCGACTVACPTCTCFTTVDKLYSENAQNGERRRVCASCQVAGFDLMAGGGEFRKTAAERTRYRALHKVHDYRARFGGSDMCVGCGRCSAHCPKLISFPATIEKMNAALREIMSENSEGGSL